MSQEAKAVPYQAGIFGWYCSWCGYANLSELSELATEHRWRLRVHRIRGIKLRCAKCGHAIRLTETAA